ncbi:MAG: phosphoenolpyruvate--protein phosphotransferase [Planctomycetota bacterium]
MPRKVPDLVQSSSNVEGERGARIFKGETVATGVALGRVFLQGFEEDSGYLERIPSDQIEDELNRLRQALDLSRKQIEELKEKHQGNLGENELRIFDVHLDYLSDPMFVDEIEKLVLQERYSVRAAIRKVVDDYDRIFQLVENDYLRQRAGDFRDVGTRVRRNIKKLESGAVPSERPSEHHILVARKLTLNDLFNLDNEQVDGIVTEEGGISSHAGILARSMGIPTITGIPDLPGKIENDDFVILDAGSAEIHINPDERLRAEFEQTAERQRNVELQVPGDDQDHSTRDGTIVELLASCGNISEVGLARTFGMDGIGLYRTELMFLVERRLPSEDMLVRHYREVIKQPSDQVVCFRLLDVTAATQVTDMPSAKERNPALGMRGIRGLLHDGQVLRLQLRAILRAAANCENAAILVPFVTGLSDLQRVKAAIIEERLELRKKKIECADTIKVAPIIEVPAAAFVLHAFIIEADFVVVAIDDLQALLLAADRDGALVREYYESVHPALFELIARMARDAARGDKKLILFGEGAADPERIPFYLGIGIRSFSVAPVRLKTMLKVLSRFNIDECRGIADKLLEAPRALDVQRVLLRVARRL